MDAFAPRACGVPHELVCVGPYGWSSRDLYDHVDRLGLRGRRALHRLRSGRGSAGHLQPRRVVRLSVALRGLRSAGRRSHGVRHAGDHREHFVAGEIAARAAETVDPLDTDAWPRHRPVASDADRRARPARAGSLVRASSRGRSTAKEMLAVYHRAPGVTVLAPEPPRAEKTGRRGRVGFARSDVVRAASARGPLPPRSSIAGAGLRRAGRREIFQLLRAARTRVFARRGSPRLARPRDRVRHRTRHRVSRVGVARESSPAIRPRRWSAARCGGSRATASSRATRPALRAAGSRGLSRCARTCAALRWHRLELRRAQLRRAPRAARHAGARAPAPGGIVRSSA